MSALTVHAPLAGRIVALAHVPDPVFAAQMVGAGLAIDPSKDSDVVEVGSPVAGKVGALHPHAFAVEADEGQVLVHLGIDTVSLHGEPFEVLTAAGQALSVGQVVIRWRIGLIGALSPLVPVVALGEQQVKALVEPGTVVQAGAAIFQIGR